MGVAFAAGSGTTAANFLSMGAGARPAGLGEAFTAVADEASGMYYNPAGPAFMYSPELQAMHSLWLGDLTYSYLGYVHPTLSGTYGIGFQYLTGPAIPKLANGVRTGDFSYYDTAATLLYAARLNDTFALGFTLRGLQSQIDTSGLTACTGDFGFLYRTIEEGFSFGAAGQNLFGKLGDDTLPLTCRAGMAFKKSLPEHNSDILFTVETVQPEGSPLYYAAGLEHWGAGTLGLRIGYKYVADERQRQALGNLAPWRAGMSLRIQSLALDYTYQPFDALGETHRLTLTWRLFGWKTVWRMAPAQVKADPTIFSPNNDGAKDSIFFIPQAPDIRDVKNWSLDIQDASRVPVMKFSGKDVLPKILSWEGQIEAGGQVVEGKYYYVFIAEGDGRKRARSDTGEITADLTPPAASLQVSNDILSSIDPMKSGTTFYVSVSDLYNVDQWQLSVLNSRGRTAKVFTSSASVPVEIFWDGKDDYYGAYVPEGEYEARLVAWDTAGNRSKASVKLRVQPRIQVKEVIREVVKPIEVKQEARGLVVDLSSQVLFDIGKTKIKPIAYHSLDEVVNLLQTYPENDVLIEGYTDSTGSRAKNLEISSARAWAVYSYFVKKGVAPVRLKPKGYGPDKPVEANSTAWGRAQNRRVKIVILKKELSSTMPPNTPPLTAGTTIPQQ
jgi:outer membrane protein OmpA-like peptidoglycan-associated protein